MLEIRSLRVKLMKSNTRIGLAFFLSFFLGFIVAFSNKRDILLSIQSSFIFAVLVALVVALLVWGMNIAVKKGYPDWVGFFLVLVLNILGIFLLAILPSKTATTKQGSK